LKLGFTKETNNPDGIIQQPADIMKTTDGKTNTSAHPDLSTYRRYRVPSLERVLLMLETLARNPTGMTLMELVKELQIPKAGAFRIVTTLFHHNYIHRNEATGKITLSRKILAIGNSTICQYNMIEEALPFMRSLRNDTGETVQLNTHIGHEGVVLEQVPSIHEIRIVVDPGTRFGLHCSAPGKAILAFIPEAEREQILSKMPFPRRSPTTITDRREFHRELARARETGYATDRAEGIVIGLHCVSAPIFDQNAYPVGALTITAPAARMPVKVFPKFAISAMKHASQLSFKLGYKMLADPPGLEGNKNT